MCLRLFLDKRLPASFFSMQLILTESYVTLIFVFQTLFCSMICNVLISSKGFFVLSQAQAETCAYI